MKSQRLDFVPPEGSTPEGHQAGEDFDLVCTFRVKGNGYVTLVRFGDFPIGKDDPEVPSLRKVAESTAGAMPASGPMEGSYGS